QARGSWPQSALSDAGSHSLPTTDTDEQLLGTFLQLLAAHWPSWIRLCSREHNIHKAPARHTGASTRVHIHPSKIFRQAHRYFSQRGITRACIGYNKRTFFPVINIHGDTDITEIPCALEGKKATREDKVRHLPRIHVPTYIRHGQA